MGKRPCIFPYYGGKYRQAPRLLELMPEPKPWKYTEGFAGALNVYSAVPDEWCSAVAIIDTDRDLTNLYGVLALRKDEFFRELAWLPEGSEGLFRTLSAVYRDQGEWESHGEVKRAVWYYWMLKNRYFGMRAGKRRMGTYSGLLGGTGSGEKIHTRRSPMGTGLGELGRKLQRADVRTGSALELLPKYFDGIDAFWYLDPPYARRHKKLYHEEGSTGDAEFFARLFGVLRHAQAKWMLTVDLENGIGEMLDPEWRVVPLGTRYQAANVGPRRTVSSEVAVLNYVPPEEE